MMTINYQQLLTFVLLCTTNMCQSARILAVVFAASYSNQAYFHVLWSELALRGHEVVVLTTHPSHENITNLKEVDMSSAKLVYEEGIQNAIENHNNKLVALSEWIRMYYKLLETEYSLPQVQNIINNPKQKFDLIFAQVVYPAYHVLKDVFKCPIIGIQSMEINNIIHESMGNPTHPVLYPFSIFLNSLDNTFVNRIVSFLGNMMISKSTKMYSDINKLNRKYIRKDIPDSREFLSQLDMLFINNNPLFCGVRPVTPSTISLAGGMHITPPKKLPKDLKKFLDESTQGVIYFSLGTNVKPKNLSKKTLDILMEAFSQVPYNILWKFEEMNLLRKIDNVKIIQWAPQQDVLRHKNIKLFITQAGLQSLEEALFNHVPVITFPFMADQSINALRIEAMEVGLKMNFDSLSVQELKDGLNKVITDPKYKNNMKRMAEQIQDQPMTPLERAVWWTEYILRHKTGEHLKGPKIPNYQYWYIDVLAFLGSSTLVMLIGLYYFCKLWFRMIKNLIFKPFLKLKSH